MEMSKELIERNRSCKARVKKAFESRMEDIKKLVAVDREEIKGKKAEKIREEIGELNEYGLCIDLVEAGTFRDQREDYIRYQLSWGGPSEEFRIFKTGEVEFWLLDWFDGAPIEVIGEDADIIKDIVSPTSWGVGWDI